ncbi:MAG: MCE family protein [Acidimicrobiia bacterium]|nr:MCE family protein [Acidimicrobiia bacterium]
MGSRVVMRRVFAVVGAALALFGAWWLLTAATASPGTTAYVARFERVVGLVPFSEVSLAGAKVGEVKEILITEDGMQADVVLAVDEDVALMKDASAEVKVKSLLGELYIDLDAGRSEVPLRKSASQNDGGRPRITHTSSDQSLDELLFSVSGLLGEVSDSKQVASLVEELTTVFRGRGEDMEAILADSQVLLGALADNSATLSRLVTNLDILTESLDGRTDALGGVLATASARLVELRGSLAGNVAAMESTLVSLREALASLDSARVDQALSEIPLWLEKIDGVIGLLGDLVNRERPIAAFVVSLPDMNSNVLAPVRQAKHIPWLRDALIAMLEDAIAHM